MADVGPTDTHESKTSDQECFATPNLTLKFPFSKNAAFKDQELTDTEFTECLSCLVSQTKIGIPLNLYVGMMIRTQEVSKYSVVMVCTKKEREKAFNIYVYVIVSMHRLVFNSFSCAVFVLLLQTPSA